MRELPDFTDDEIKIFALVLGFLLGAVLIMAARDLMGELLEAQDQAARRRFRDLFAELLQARDSAAAELPQDRPAAEPAAAISTRTGPRLIAVNEDREAATDASNPGANTSTD